MIFSHGWLPPSMQAFYFPEGDMMNWIAQNCGSYHFRQMVWLLNAGLGAKKKKKGLKDLVVQVREAVHGVSLMLFHVRMLISQLFSMFVVWTIRLQTTITRPARSASFKVNELQYSATNSSLFYP